MTTLFAAPFETAADGAVLTTSNTQFNSLVQPGWTSDTSIKSPLDGSTRSGKVVSTGAASVIAQSTISGAPLVQIQFDHRLDVAPASGLDPIVQLNVAGGTVAAELRVNATSAYQTRNKDFLQAIITPNNTAKQTQFVRVIWVYDSVSASHRLTVYDPSDLSQPIYSSGPIATTVLGAITMVGFGSFVGSQVVTEHFDNIVVTDTVVVPPVSNPFVYYDNGTAWVDVTDKLTYDNGTNWSAVTV